MEASAAAPAAALARSAGSGPRPAPQGSPQPPGRRSARRAPEGLDAAHSASRGHLGVVVGFRHLKNTFIGRRPAKRLPPIRRVGILESASTSGVMLSPPRFCATATATPAAAFARSSCPPA